MQDQNKTLSDRMKAVLDDAVSQGRERGVQLAVYVDGHLVLDAYSGTTDRVSKKRVTSETLFPVFSVTKAMAVTAVHQYVERGLIDYETPLAKVWPEFGARGKDAVTLRHALSHMAGVPLMPAGLTHADICDWTTMCRRIADLTPEWPAGSRMMYHPMTHGWLLGEVMRRLDGRSFREILEQDICRPLGIVGEMFCGMPESAEPRVAELEEIYEPGKEPTGVEDGVARPVPAIVEPLYRFMNRSDARHACIPASNGIMSARSIARFYAALAPGGVDGVELLTPKRVAIATQRQWPTTDFPAPPRIGLGYFLGKGLNEAITNDAAFGHAGYGGSIGFYDPEHRLAVGFTKNLFSARAAGSAIFPALREALGIR